MNNIKVSVIISACDGRIKLFENSLYTYYKQNFPKKFFEILVIDDKDRVEVCSLCKEFNKNFGLNFQYIKIDPTKINYHTNSFTPALTNNIGFKLALGDVVVISGPETLICENNIKIASTMINRKECAYGLVFRSSYEFNEHLSDDKNWKLNNFSYLLNIPGARSDCRTCPPHPPAYWYFMAVNKTYVFAIHGVDERFLNGLCAEDDDFANRMKFLGINPVFEHRMIGIHQDHSIVDKNDEVHNVRFTKKFNQLKSNNLILMKENLLSKNPISNNNIEWGNLEAIVSKEILY
ncbi:MAG: glycosyltransferase family A protein [Patescibacteria group bacterium]|jgi:hypothetical protein